MGERQGEARLVARGRGRERGRGRGREASPRESGRLRVEAEAEAGEEAEMKASASRMWRWVGRCMAEAERAGRASSAAVVPGADEVVCIVAAGGRRHGRGEASWRAGGRAGCLCWCWCWCWWGRGVEEADDGGRSTVERQASIGGVRCARAWRVCGRRAVRGRRLSRRVPGDRVAAALWGACPSAPHGACVHCSPVPSSRRRLGGCAAPLGRAGDGTRRVLPPPAAGRTRALGAGALPPCALPLRAHGRWHGCRAWPQSTIVYRRSSVSPIDVPPPPATRAEASGGVYPSSSLARPPGLAAANRTVRAPDACLQQSASLVLALVLALVLVVVVVNARGRAAHCATAPSRTS